MLTGKQRTRLLVTLPPLVIAGATRYALHASTAVAACTAMLSFFAFCDGWYFVRLVWWYLWETVDDAIHRGRKRDNIFAASLLPGRIGLVDIDRNAHCNNSRFLRECGFARRQLWHGNGVWRMLKITGGNLVVGAQTVRYRRELSMGQKYTIESRLLCWDKKAFYVEHRFVTIGETTKKPFVNAIILVKNTVVGKLSPAKLVEKLPGLSENEANAPTMPEFVHKWVECNDRCSQALRKEAGL